MGESWKVGGKAYRGRCQAAGLWTELQDGHTSRWTVTVKRPVAQGAAVVRPWPC